MTFPSVEATGLIKHMNYGVNPSNAEIFYLGEQKKLEKYVRFSAIPKINECFIGNDIAKFPTLDKGHYVVAFAETWAKVEVYALHTWEAMHQMNLKNYTNEYNIIRWQEMTFLPGVEDDLRNGKDPCGPHLEEKSEGCIKKIMNCFLGTKPKTA